MTDYPVGEITRNGVTVPVFAENGAWKAAHAGHTWRTDTWDQLVDKITRATRQTAVKVEVPVTLVVNKGVQGIKYRRGTATGIHGSNGNVLVTWHSSRGDVKEQVTTWTNNNLYFGDVPDEVLSEYGDLVRVTAEAFKAEDEFRRKHKINLKETVEQAIEAARTESQPES
jgi:hypothetical protein